MLNENRFLGTFRGHNTRTITLAISNGGTVSGKNSSRTEAPQSSRTLAVTVCPICIARVSGVCPIPSFKFIGHPNTQDSEQVEHCRSSMPHEAHSFRIGLVLEAMFLLAN